METEPIENQSKGGGLALQSWRQICKDTDLLRIAPVPLAYIVLYVAVFVPIMAHYFPKEGYLQFLLYHYSNLLTSALALFAITYAATQTVALKIHYSKLLKLETSIQVQLDQLTEQAGELRRLGKCLSTYRKGPFPKYLRQIGKLAKKADPGDHLDILVDCLDYGSFFAPKVHQKVRDQICSAQQRGVVLRIIVCGAAPQPLTEPSGKQLGDYDQAERRLLIGRYNEILARDDDFRIFLRLLSTSDELSTFATTWFKGSFVLSPEEVRAACAKLCTDLRANGETEEAKTLTTLLQVRQLWFAMKLLDCDIAVRSVSRLEPMFFWIKYKLGKGGDTRTGDHSKEITEKGLFTFANAARGPGQLV